MAKENKTVEKVFSVYADDEMSVFDDIPEKERFEWTIDLDLKEDEVF